MGSSERPFTHPGTIPGCSISVPRHAMVCSRNTDINAIECSWGDRQPCEWYPQSEQFWIDWK
jgi:hypothetical protein